MLDYATNFFDMFSKIEMSLNIDLYLEKLLSIAQDIIDVYLKQEMSLSDNLKCLHCQAFLEVYFIEFF